MSVDEHEAEAAQGGGEAREQRRVRHGTRRRERGRPRRSRTSPTRAARSTVYNTTACALRIPLAGSRSKSNAGPATVASRSTRSSGINPARTRVRAHARSRVNRQVPRIWREPQCRRHQYGRDVQDPHSRPRPGRVPGWARQAAERAARGTGMQAQRQSRALFRGWAILRTHACPSQALRLWLRAASGSRHRTRKPAPTRPGRERRCEALCHSDDPLVGATVTKARLVATDPGSPEAKAS